MRFLVAAVIAAGLLVAMSLFWRAFGVDDAPLPPPPPKPPAAHPIVPTSTSTTTTQPPATTTTAVARTAPTVHAASASKPVPSVGDIQDAIRRVFARFGPDVADQAVRVAGCESTGDETGQRLNPAARNGAHYGLFQISRTWHDARVRRLGFTWEQMTDVDPNVAVAADLYAEQGWGPWQCRWAA